MNLDNIIKDFPSKETPIGKDLFLNLANVFYPIGKVEMFYDNEDHSSHIDSSFTWVRDFIGKVPLGIDTTQTEFNTIGKEGGAKTHTLTVNELASHRHETATSSSGSTLSAIYISGRQGGEYYPQQTSFEGGGQPHNNLQPYKVLAIWRRTV